MEIQFDWQKIHSSILYEGAAVEKTAQIAARDIALSIEREQTEPGEVFGTSPELCERFGLGRETLLEAARLLENRGIARMRRGPRGGLTALGGKRPGADVLLSRYLPGTGMTAECVQEARNAIAIMDRYTALAAGAPTERFEGAFQHMLAGRTFPIATPLPTGWTGEIRSRCLRPFADVLDRMAAQAAEASEHDPIDDTANEGLVAFTARYLSNEAFRLREAGDHKLGNELQLARRIGVSRQVLRQAMRLLEEQGLLSCRRGRSNGIVAAALHPAGLLRDLGDCFAQIGLVEAEFRPVLMILDRLNRTLFAFRGQEQHFAAMREMNIRKDWQKPATHFRRMLVEYPVIANPALTLLEQTLSAYRARRAGPGTFVTIGDTEVLHRSIFQHIDMMSARKFASADHHYVGMQRQVSTILGSF
ncbi:MAG: hypothetical protein JWR77_44 [Rhizorhabdus sp.]|nr:hypothetical protein [Rhizorhabdus sp.]